MDEVVEILTGVNINDVVNTNGELSIRFNPLIGSEGSIILECPTRLCRGAQELFSTTLLNDLDESHIISSLLLLVGSTINKVWVDSEKIVLYMVDFELTLKVRPGFDDEFSIGYRVSPSLSCSYEFRSDMDITTLRFSI